MKHTHFLSVIFWGISCGIFLSSCMGNNPKTKKNNQLSTNAVVSKATTGLMAGAIPTKTDTTIEYKRTANGNSVCTYPSGKCRTNADEYSGGASLYGDIPGSGSSFIHYMKFKLYSNGYFAKNPDGHFAFGLRGQYLSYEEYKEKAGHDGKGIIFGAIGFGYPPNKNNPACVTRMLQAESWFVSHKLKNNLPGGNAIFPQTCSDTILEDYKWYTIEIEVTSHHYIIYRVYNESGGLIYKNYYNDLPNLKEPSLTGWFIGHVFENQNAEWSLRLENFEVGHIPNGDTLYPLKDYKPAIYISLNDEALTRENANNFSLKINKDLPANVKVHNVINRTRLWSCASLRATKDARDSVDCLNWENYREIKFGSQGEWIHQGDKLVLKADYLKTIPNQFYSVYFRQNPQDELSQVSMAFELTGSSTSSAAKSGSFCDVNNKTLTSWMCDGTPTGPGWVHVGGGCYHKGSTTKCTP